MVDTFEIEMLMQSPPDVADLFESLTRRPAWMRDGACVGESTEAFFGATTGHSWDEAKAICALCPVRRECLQHALDQPEDYGLWGGLSPEERRKLKRKRTRRTEIGLEECG